jgi:hypothetical protein
MRSSEQKFIISLFSIFIADVFSKSIFLKYHCIFSLYKLLTLSLENPHVYKKIIFYVYQLQSPGLPGTSCYYYSYQSTALPDVT